MATNSQTTKEVSNGQTTLDAFERVDDACENGETHCCGPDGIRVTDDEFDHEGAFPCLNCFLDFHRNADREVLA